MGETLTASTDYMKTWFPWLHEVYSNVLPVIESDGLQRNFAKSDFASITFNFPPNTVCRVHLDHLNWAPGICAVTAGGSYDFRKGGHLVLWDQKLIIEFPPGTTLLIPSACVLHGNTPIQEGEKRFSITQYSAGGLFRWVDLGSRTAKSLPQHLSKGVEAFAKQRWEDGVNLYSNLNVLKGKSS